MAHNSTHGLVVETERPNIKANIPEDRDQGWHDEWEVAPVADLALEGLNLLELHYAVNQIVICERARATAGKV